MQRGRCSRNRLRRRIVRNTIQDRHPVRCSDDSRIDDDDSSSSMYYRIRTTPRRGAGAGAGAGPHARARAGTVIGTLQLYRVRHSCAVRYRTAV